MKKSTRIISLFLAFVLLITSVAGCGKKAVGDSPFLSKREFINLFVSETMVPAADYDQTKVSIKSDDPCYEAARALVEIGFMKDEELSDKLDEAVTKEFVATLCVRSLYFRKNFKNIVLKDADKLADPEACRDAVGHKIVADENGYFNAYKGMTYAECKAAIDRTTEIDATTTFSKEDMDVDFEFKENVVDISNDINIEDVEYVDMDDPKMQDIFDELYRKWQTGETGANAGRMIKNKAVAPVQDGPIKVSNAKFDNNAEGNIISTSSSEKPKVCSNFDDAEDDELLMLRFDNFSLIGMKVEVGKYIVFGLLQPGWNLDSYNTEILKKHPGVGCGEVLAIDKEKDPPHTYILIRVASEDEVLDAAKMNGYSSNSQGIKWNSEQLCSEFDGAKIGGFQVTNSGIKLTIKKTVGKTADSWRDSEFKTDIEYNFEIKDIGITVDGFGDVLKGNIKNAICRLDYTIVNHFNAHQEARLTPDDNRNGKFFNNLSRSRFTGANAAGAKEIKIARVYADLGYGFNVEMYVYLKVTVDGTIDITLTNQYQRGFKIINNKVEPIKVNKSDLKLEINVNAEATVNFDFNLRWIRRKGTPWADVKFYIGCELGCISKVFVLSESGKEYTDIKNGFISEAELRATKTSLNIDYCFELSLSLIWELEGLSDSCRIGKVVRFFDKSFKLSTGRQTIPLLQYHWEDGHRTDGDICTRNYKDDQKSDTKSDSKQAGADKTFILDQYKIVVPNYCCNDFHILSYPVDTEKIEDMGGIKLVVEDEKVATAHLYKDYIVIESVGEGSTQMKIMTGNGRYVQECSITVTENEN